MTRDPYAPPQAAELESTIASAASTDLRWRGVAWFLVPLLAMVAILEAVDALDGAMVLATKLRQLFEMTISVFVPAAIVGYASGRRCRSTTWRRFVVLAIMDASLWALYATLLLWLPEFGSWRFARMAMTFLRLEAVLLPILLLLATTMRFHYRRRP